MKDALTKWRGMVWEFRRQMAGYWPTPDTLDAARFAVTEIGEAMDAFLRLDGGYARNRQRDPDVLDELADVAMMTLTAMGERAPLDEWAEQWQGEEADVWGIYEDLDEIDALVMLVKDFFACAAVPHPSPVSLAGFGGLVVWRISEYAGMDLEARLKRRFDRIFRKHHPDGQQLAKLEQERNGQADGPTNGASGGIVYRSETGVPYDAKDYAGYFPE